MEYLISRTPVHYLAILVTQWLMDPSLLVSVITPGVAWMLNVEEVCNNRII